MMEFLKTYAEYIILALCVALALLLFFTSRKKEKTLNTKTIVYGSICIALSLVLNMIPIFSMPNGGSVTLARLVPLLVFAYVFGWRRGLIVGMIYGVLDFLAKPYFLNIFQFLLDYPLPFACVCFAGVFNKNEKMSKFSFVLGTVITGLTRWLFSSISGTLYWGLLFDASLAYNAVLLVDTAVCLVVIIPLQASSAFRNLVLETRKSSATNIAQKSDDETPKQ